MDLTQLFQSTQFLFVLKIGLLLVLFLYVLFSCIVFNQIRRMNGIIKEVFSTPLINVLALVHIALAFSLFIAAVVIL